MGLAYFIAIPFLILAFLAQGNVGRAFKKYSRIPNKRGMTGAQTAEYILRTNGISDVSVESLSGGAGDHYDPNAKAIRLSYENFHNASLCSIAVAAHEAGHAIQHATGYGGIKLRWAFLMPANIGSNLAVPLAIAGFFFNTPFLVDLGIIFYVAVVMFHIVTLPVEFNASSRAMRIMTDSMLLDEGELSGARRLLNAAALTYVAAAGVAVGELIRLLVLRGSMDND